MKPDLVRRQALRTGAVLGLAPWWLAGQADATVPATRELRIATPPDSAAGRQIVQALKLRYPGMVSEGDVAGAAAASSAEGRRATTSAQAPQLAQPWQVAIGSAALRRALEAGLKSPLISVLTSSQVYRQLLAADADSSTTPSLRERPPITAVYAEASPRAQMQLIAELFEGRVVVGVLLSEASAHLEHPLRHAANHLGLELVVEKIAPSDDVVRALNRVRGVQVLLAVPDSTLYTPDTLRAVLESTYRHGLPVVGFSPGTVAAGTLASACCAPEDVIADLFDLLEGAGVGQSGPWPEPHFPRYWRVAVNERVARSLGVALSDKVRRLGNPPGVGRAE